MEFGQYAPLRMAVIMLTLLLLVQFSRIDASMFSRDSKACGTYHVVYSSDAGHELFYINGKIADKDSFCKVLKYGLANHCLLTGNLGNRFCGLDLSSGELPLEGGRKFLRKVLREESGGVDFGAHIQPTEENEAQKSPLSSKSLAIAIPGMFLLCCGLLCPCFQAKRKEATQGILTKDPNSMHSVSSMEMNSISEKIPASPLRVPPSPSRFSMSPKLSRIGSIHLSMNQVTRATHNFSPSLKVGEGGFGTVYRAQLEDGQVVAIKRARKELFEALRTEFSSEVELLAKIDHRNLVKLLGYVDKGNERLIITEYVPNGTLREHLDGLRGKILDFNQRLEISIDVAHGLTYLHLYAEKQIIHRDVKSSNILLTESLRAKVADFGFARLGEMDSDTSHVVTKVRGTVGYLDPEYMRTNRLTHKSDVYSFGVLLIEILTGRRPVEMKRSNDDRVTVRWVFRKYNEGSIMELVDPLMKETLDEQLLVKIFSLAIQCAAPTRTDRPDMKTVGEQLWSIRMDYLRSGSRE